MDPLLWASDVGIAKVTPETVSEPEANPNPGPKLKLRLSLHRDPKVYRSLSQSRSRPRNLSQFRAYRSQN